jgi:outer membrane protein assembly factor BamB
MPVPKSIYCRLDHRSNKKNLRVAGSHLLAGLPPDGRDADSRRDAGGLLPKFTRSHGSGGVHNFLPRSSSKPRNGFVLVNLRFRENFMTQRRVAVCLLSGILCVLLAASAFAAAEPVAVFRADLAHTGVYPSPGLTSLHGIKWKIHTGGQVISSPIVAAGVVYVGSTDHMLYAIDAKTGAVRWKFDAKSRVPSSPAVADGVVYFLSYDGNLYAVDAGTGKAKWQFATGGEHRFTATHLHGVQPAAERMPDPFDFYLSSPAVWESAVYFGSGDGYVYAIEAATGRLKWKFKTGDVVHASPAIADGTLYIGSWDSYFYALDATTGKEKWRFKTGEDPETHNQVGIQSSAAVLDGTVYFGCRDSNFYALNAATGEKRWVFNNKGSWVIGSPAVNGGKVYFATSDSGLFYALDAKTGARIFSWDSKKWPMFSSPAIAGNMLYIGTHAGKLIAVDLDGQKQAWVFETDGALRNGATYTKPDGTPNYAAAFTGDFYDEMVAGVQKMMSVGAILSSPAVADGVVYIGSTDGNVYALQ